MLVVSCNEIFNYKITETFSTTIGIGMASSMVVSPGIFKEVIEKAEREMINEANKLGANAIISTSYAFDRMDGYYCCIVTGTPVIYK